MVRTQISLEAEEMDGLRRLASERGASIASLLREAVDELLADRVWSEVRARARRAAGSVKGPVTAVSVDHDAALFDAFVV